MQADGAKGLSVAVIGGRPVKPEGGGRDASDALLAGGGIAGLACARRLGHDPGSLLKLRCASMRLSRLASFAKNLAGSLGLKATVFDTGKRGPGPC